MSWIDPNFPKTATVSALVGRVLGLNPGMMTGPGTNTYLIGQRDPILLDTGAGVPEYMNGLTDYLAERGWKQPSRVVLTHRHRDHLGGVAHLPTTSVTTCPRRTRSSPATSCWPAPRP
jgi:glyoxylase-like metal-dependent hydrolase (beta-lactamase superfamily II)